MADSLFLSVLVTSYNQREHLERLLPRLLIQNYPRAQFEIVVVDDGSTDGTREWLQKHAGEIVLILNDSNLGRAVSRNHAIKAARGHILVMIDGDHLVESNFLATHAACHEQERCVIVGKSVFIDHPQCRALNHYLNNAGAAKLPARAKLPGRYFLTRNCSLPRDLLESVGNFDERFVHWGGEDLDLGVRLEESGVPIYAEPLALAIHNHVRPQKELLNVLYAYGRDGIPLLLQKHPRLFVELNLDHVIALPGIPSRFGPLHRAIFHAIFSSFIFSCVSAFAELFRRYKLPRAVFDYLHLRTYSRGFQDSLSAPSRS